MPHFSHSFPHLCMKHRNHYYQHHTYATSAVPITPLVLLMTTNSFFQIPKLSTWSHSSLASIEASGPRAVLASPFLTLPRRSQTQFIRTKSGPGNCNDEERRMQNHQGGMWEKERFILRMYHTKLPPPGSRSTTEHKGSDRNDVHVLQHYSHHDCFQRPTIWLTGFLK